MANRLISVDSVTTLLPQLVRDTLAEQFPDMGRIGIVVPENAGYTEIQAACTSAATFGTRVWAAGEITTSETLVIACDCDLSGLTINYTGSGTAVRAGATSGYVMHKDMRLPIVWNANKATAGWAEVAGTIGVDLCNLYSAEVYVPHVKGFEVGLREYGMASNGISYVTIAVGHLDNNKVNQKLDASSTGWANQITHIGGRWSHNSGEGTNVSGTKHILVENITGNADPNNNLWLNASLESPTVVEFTIDAQGGSRNMWFNPRMEFTAGASKVRWGSGAVHNTIFGGNQVDSITETFVAGASSNSVIGTGKFRFSGQGTSGGMILENEGSAAQPAMTIMRTGGTAAGDVPATAYVQRFESNQHKMKPYNASFDRYLANGSNGSLLLGDGTAAPVSGISGVGAFLFFTAGATTVGHVSDNTADLGGASNYRFRYIRAGTAIRTGTFATGGRPAAATAGAGAMVFDTTLNKPIWSTGAVWVDATGTTV